MRLRASEKVLQLELVVSFLACSSSREVKAATSEVQQASV